MKGSTQDSSSDGMLSIDTAIANAFELITHLAEEKPSAICQGDSRRIPTGFKAIDKRTFGLWPGELSVVTGSPAVGKTSFAINVAVNAAKRGVRVLLIALGSSVTDTAVRMCASDGGIQKRHLLDGYITEGDWGSLADTANRLAALDLYICDDVNLTPEAFRSLVLKTVRETDRALVVIDGVELFALPNNSKLCNWPRFMGEYCLFLKKVARSSNASILITAQKRHDGMWREAEDYEDVFGTLPAGVADAADMILHIDRPLISDERKRIPSHRVAHVILAKSGLSAPARMKLEFDPRTSRFTDCIDDDHSVFEGDESIDCYAGDEATAAYSSYEEMVLGVETKAIAHTEWASEQLFHLLFRSTIEASSYEARELICKDPGLCAVSSRAVDRETRAITLERWDFRCARCGHMVELDRSGGVVSASTVSDQSQDWVFEIEELLSHDSWTHDAYSIGKTAISCEITPPDGQRECPHCEKRAELAFAR